MKQLCVIVMVASMAGCSNACSSNSALQKTAESDLLQTKGLLMAQAPTGASAFAVCGASYGQAVYLDFEEKKWASDQISKGRFAFVRGPSGDFDYIFLDATGRVISAVEDGGEVRQIYEAGNGEDAAFTVTYPETGVLETYNITSDLEGGRVALWTTNKAVTAMPAKVGAFLASCISG